MPPRIATTFAFFEIPASLGLLLYYYSCASMGMFDLLVNLVMLIRNGIIKLIPNTLRNQTAQIGFIPGLIGDTT